MVFSQIKVVNYGDTKKVLKRYNSINSKKWLLSPLFQIVYPFATLSKSRLERELEFLNSNNQIKKPKVYGFNLEKKELYREYINGKSAYCDGSKIGELLYEIHREGYCLGDSKLDNFVFDGDNTYIIDAEQAMKTRNKRYMYWDISLLILSAAYYNYSDINGFKSFLEGFSNNYKYWKEYCKRSLKGLYSLLFLLMPVQHLRALKDTFYPK